MKNNNLKIMIPTSLYRKKFSIFPSQSLLYFHRFASSISKHNANLHPQFVTGFTDAEGCFMISVTQKSKNNKWQVLALFQLNLHSRDLPLLNKLQSFFGGIGNINVSNTARGQKATFLVTKIDDPGLRPGWPPASLGGPQLINVIIPHFKENPLQSAKKVDTQLWQECVELIKNKEHLTEEGLNKILALKAALNNGLTEKLKGAFPNVIPENRPVYLIDEAPLDPNWVSGFSEGDSCFLVKTYTKTKQVINEFAIDLNERDIPLLHKIQKFFGDIGKMYYTPNRHSARFVVANIKQSVSVLLPHFNSYRLEGNKLSSSAAAPGACRRQGYLIWSKILLLVQSKAHLKPEGFDKINILKKNMNK
jgi:hypothetical protein